ncbi:MAG: hypothetical protein ACFFD7_12415 [Candidatus Thorarchaeota archaeon]
MIILEPALFASVRRQNSYIIIYATLLFIGMLVLILPPFEGVSIHSSSYIKWNPYFFAYLYSIVFCLAIIPIFYSSFKIYFKLETKEHKRKWFYYLIGSLGLVAFVLLPFHIANLLVYIMEEDLSFLNILWTVENVLALTVFLWVSLMYYGISTLLDLSNIYFLID